MSNFVDDIDRGVLLYVGALYDSYPLCIEMLRKNHSIIIYTDSLPESQYYKNLTSEQEILEILMKEGGSYAFIDGNFELNEEDGSFEGTLKDNCKFKYFFNTDNIDSSKITQPLLDKVTTLWIHGYEMPVDELQKLPNLKMVYCAASCIGETYWKAREIINTIDDEELLVQYNMKCLIPDILRWIENVGFDMRGVDWLQDILFECDAPYQYIIDDEDDDEDEDDEYNEDDNHYNEGNMENEDL